MKIQWDTTGPLSMRFRFVDDEGLCVAVPAAFERVDGRDVLRATAAVPFGARIGGVEMVRDGVVVARDDSFRLPEGAIVHRVELKDAPPPGVDGLPSVRLAVVYEVPGERPPYAFLIKPDDGSSWRDRPSFLGGA